MATEAINKASTYMVELVALYNARSINMHMNSCCAARGTNNRNCENFEAGFY